MKVQTVNNIVRVTHFREANTETGEVVSIVDRVEETTKDNINAQIDILNSQIEQIKAAKNVLVEIKSKISRL